MSTSLIWSGIALCLIQSGLFSGLNLALLGLSRLQLEVEARSGSDGARRILALRTDSNFLLTTILWGNVATNCLLTLLSDSVLFGVAAFVFSTVGITVVGEIVPQAYFSRNAIRIGAALSPFIRLYQWILFPVAKPTALLLDYWLGQEEVSYFREHELREVIRRHMVSDEADLERREALGVLNFLVLDDLAVREEGEEIHPDSIITLPVSLDLPRFPPFDSSTHDDFLRKIHASGEKWVILTGPDGEPLVVLDADGFLRDALFGGNEVDPYRFCHRPVVVRDPATPLGTMVRRLKVEAETRQDDVIDHDVILLWGEERRIVTGADLLGRIMRGIVVRTISPLDAQARNGTLTLLTCDGDPQPGGGTITALIYANFPATPHAAKKTVTFIGSDHNTTDGIFAFRKNSLTRVVSNGAGAPAGGVFGFIEGMSPTTAGKSVFFRSDLFGAPAGQGIFVATLR